MSNKKPSNELERIVFAFGYALKGVSFALSQRGAFRTELCIAIIMTIAAFFITDATVERALLIGSLLLVLIVELLNTGIECAIDRISPEWHEISGHAKDVASAAVLVSLINAGVIWGLILFS